MEFSSVFKDTLRGQKRKRNQRSSIANNYKDNPLATLALNIVKRDTEKAALLRLKGFDRVDIERSRGKHSVVCRHWLKGMCMKGEFCDFLHQLVYSRMPPCKTVEKSSFCTDRLKGCCIFKHQDEDAFDGSSFKEIKKERDVPQELSYFKNPERFTQAFNAAILYAFPRIVEYA
ncbi:cleavage and polyadenylation specificity factor subunit 4 [Theileria orientalis]|uniref:Cleavage and polyadenylation specificity factor subunit 4 n=1 Tax=Theileria orientalis TaxID=68886 RepID=A0A976MER5_THEOR|nr:cleavage and polyadenylation specificity factor subunit 4 [Theileria orientalis]